LFRIRSALPRGHEVGYKYDAADRLATVTDPPGRVRSYGYDADGRQTSLVTARGNAAGQQGGASTVAAGTVTAGYDSLGRLLSRSLGTSTPTFTWTYDPGNRRTGSTEPGGTQTREYDDAGRLTAVARGSDRFEYDRAGRLTGVSTHPCGSRRRPGSHDAGRRKSDAVPLRDPGSVPQGRAVTDDELRAAFRDAVDIEQVAAKDSQGALPRLFEKYRSLSAPEREIVDELISLDAASSDETRRFYAVALIAEFRIVSAVPALRALANRLESDPGPGAPFEWAKVNRVIGELLAGGQRPE
jgi:YD repeat-containing protein